MKKLLIVLCLLFISCNYVCAVDKDKVVREKSLDNDNNFIFGNGSNDDSVNLIIELSTKNVKY